MERQKRPTSRGGTATSGPAGGGILLYLSVKRLVGGAWRVELA